MSPPPAGLGRHESMNVPSSQMNTSSVSEDVGGTTMSGAEPFFGSGWEPNPMVSLSQIGNYEGPSMVSQSEFRDPHYVAVMENQGVGSASHFSQYPSNPNFFELGSGNFSGMVGSYDNNMHRSSQIVDCRFPLNYVPSQQEGSNEGISANGAQSHEECQISEEGTVGASPKGKRRKRVPDLFNNADEKPQKNTSGDSCDAPREHDEKNLKIDQTTAASSRGKQVSKAAKDVTQTGDGSKEDYLHMRARRGQATNSHSLAERVRREKIRDRMGLLQEIVPGCNKITGKAVMLDEIINYVQSLQQQVEFLSMKLATVNPELNIDLDRLMSKDILHSRGGAAAFLGFGPSINSSHPYPPLGTMSSIPTANPQFPLPPQISLDNELHNLLQMGFNPSSAIDSLGPNSGRMKS